MLVFRGGASYLDYCLNFLFLLNLAQLDRECVLKVNWVYFKFTLALCCI